MSEYLRTHNGTMHGYSVEVRYNYHVPVVIGNQAIDNRWKPLDISIIQGPGGVSNPNRYIHDTGVHGLYTYTAAQALRWQFLAWLEAYQDHNKVCIETRILCHKYKYSSEVEHGVPEEVIGYNGKVIEDEE